jgi:hypothetical protein
MSEKVDYKLKNIFFIILRENSSRYIIKQVNFDNIDQIKIKVIKN